MTGIVFAEEIATAHHFDGAHRELAGKIAALATLLIHWSTLWSAFVSETTQDLRWKQRRNMLEDIYYA